MSNRDCGDAAVLHVTHKLPGNFLEYLLSKIAAFHRILEAHKLDDVTFRILSAITETATIAIKLLHGGEVCISNTNNDDGAGELGKCNDRIDRGRHVMNSSISEDQQDRIRVAVHDRLNELAELVEEWAEVGRTRQLNGLERLLVHLDNILDVLDLRVS